MIANGAMTVMDGQTFEHCDLFKCPVCGVGLWVAMIGFSTEQNQVTVFCGNGRCESQVTNNGSSGKDVETAIAELESKVEEERARSAEAYWAVTMTDEEHADYCEARNEQIRNEKFI